MLCSRKKIGFPPNAALFFISPMLMQKLSWLQSWHYIVWEHVKHNGLSFNCSICPSVNYLSTKGNYPQGKAWHVLFVYASVIMSVWEYQKPYCFYCETLITENDPIGFVHPAFKIMELRDILYPSSPWYDAADEWLRLFRWCISYISLRIIGQIKNSSDLFHVTIKLDIL